MRICSNTGFHCSLIQCEWITKNFVDYWNDSLVLDGEISTRLQLIRNALLPALSFKFQSYIFEPDCDCEKNREKKLKYFLFGTIRQNLNKNQRLSFKLITLTLKQSKKWFQLKIPRDLGLLFWWIQLIMSKFSFSLFTAKVESIYTRHSNENLTLFKSEMDL